MKKFVAPQVRVIQYNTGLLCTSPTTGVGKDPTDPNNQDDDWNAPVRRSIFD